MNRNEAENVNDPFSNLESGRIVPFCIVRKVGYEAVKCHCGDLEGAELISGWFLCRPLECLDHVSKVGLITIMISVSNEEN